MPQQHTQQRRPSLYTLLAADLLLCGLVLASCNPSNASPANQSVSGTSHYQIPTDTFPINHPVTTTGCGQSYPIPPGSSVNVTIAAHPAEAHGSSTRTYRLHMPKVYDANKLTAVVLVFHGFGGTATGMERGSGFSTLADQQGFIAVYPQGLLDPYSNKPFWAEIGPIDFGIDDVLFVSDILNDLQKEFCVDAHRIYATGFSNGGGMATLLACRFAGRIAAFAPISANAYAIPGGCHPARPVPILNMHGSADTLLPYNGIPLSVNPDWPLPSIPEYLQAWAARDSCTRGPSIFLRESRVTGEQWTGCRGNVSVVHYRIEGGGHSWPPLIGGRTPAEVMWLFFAQYPL